MAYHDDMETPESYTLHAVNSALDKAMEQRVAALEAELNMQGVLIKALKEEKEDLEGSCAELVALIDDRDREISDLMTELYNRNEEIADLYMQMSEE